MLRKLIGWTGVSPAYGLSGERKKAAIKQYMLSLVVPFAVGAAGYLIYLFIIKSAPGPQFIYFLVIPTVVVLGIYALVKREAKWQLWFRERHAIKHRKDQNLQELLQFAEQQKQKGGDNHER